MCVSDCCAPACVARRVLFPRGRECFGQLVDLVLHGGRWEDEAGGGGRGGAEGDRVVGELGLGMGHVGGALVVDVVLHGWARGRWDAAALWYI